MTGSAVIAERSWLIPFRNKRAKTMKRVKKRFLKTRHKREALLAVFISSLFLLPVLSSGEEMVQDRVVQGKVVNKTLEDKNEAGLDVVLNLYDGKKSTEIKRTVTGPDGSYTFKGQDMNQKGVYYSLVKYKGVDYTSIPHRFKEDEFAPVVLDLNVFEPTEKDDDISVKMHHVLIDKDGDLLGVKELLEVENRGNKVYVGWREAEPGKKETMRISLPEGASDVKFLQSTTGWRVVQVKDGFLYTLPIMPGVSQLQFSYTIDTKGEDFKFLKTLNIKTDKFWIIYPDGTFQVSSDQLKFAGPMEEKDQKYYTLSGQDFPRGFQITANFTKISGTRNIKTWIVIGFGGIILGIGIGFPLLKNKNRTMIETATEKIGALSRQDVLQAVADLDDLSRAGQIDPGIYHEKRAELIETAKELSDTL
jgi:hypothetical protein